jgi:hypothetical protein
VAELPAEPAQLRLLRQRERAQLAHDVSHVPRKDPADQAAALVGERDGDEATVVGPALPPNEAPPGEVADHDRDVAAAAQELPAQIALAEGPEVQERLQGAELPTVRSAARISGSSRAVTESAARMSLM